ncbi:hypothetical protein LTR36_003358 [Oleoguttula mirabilis]|uniref:Uncharacterized protein n=1 Tax=Oleoguttula mirabilis TaxID=1507867 RepID=A0AAV9JZC7_9PEZI|nr:hypothetical protein LTR36_003358 [Oleoguttula mirabilis]
MAPVPIALCGKSSSMAGSFVDSMLPEYEIVHHFQDTAAVHKDLPPLLRGERATPSSNAGSNSNADQPTKIPKAVVVGAGFSEAELDEMRTTEGAQSLPWLYPDPLKSAASMLTGPFLMKVIVKRVKGCLKANGLVEGQEAPEAKGIWSF